MKKNLFLFFITLTLSFNSIAQTPGSCGFEDSTFTGWTGSWSADYLRDTTYNTTSNTPSNIVFTPGINPNFVKIVDVSQNAYPAPGNSLSTRINITSGTVRLSYTFTLTSTDSVFMYHYMVPVSNSGHNPDEVPYFKVDLFNSANTTLPAYGFIINEYNSSNVPWTTVMLNPGPGTYTIEFTVTSCALGGHAGIAYIDYECPTSMAISESLQSGGCGILSAPAGMSSYSWSGPVGAITHNGNFPIVQVTQPGIYTCTCLTDTSSSGQTLVFTDTVTTAEIDPQYLLNAGISAPALNCQGNAVQFTDASSSSGTIDLHLWNFGSDAAGDTSTLLNPSYVYDTSGVYQVHYRIESGGCYDDTLVQINVSSKPFAAGAISGSDSFAACGTALNVQYSIPVISNADNYHWHLPNGTTIVSGDSTDTIVIDYPSPLQAGNISIYGENHCGAGDSSVLAITVIDPQPLELCLVTVDSASQYNRIIWEAPTSAVIDSVIIYRQVSVSAFQRIGAVSYYDPSSFTDTTANPNTYSRIYKIGVKENCGNESAMSNNPHKTILLQASLGVSNTVNLSWNEYEGATVDYYRILRDGNGSGVYSPIDIVPGNITAYTDVNPTGNPNAKYRLNVIWQTVCGNVSTSFSNARTISGTVTGLNATANNNIVMSPNPAKDFISINIAGFSNELNLVIYNALGQAVKQTVIRQAQQSIDINTLPAGAYYYSVMQNNSIIKQGKLMVE